MAAMDEDYPLLKPGLRCRVEIDCDNAAMAVRALRDIAEKIEQEKMTDGFHRIERSDGKNIGMINLLHYEEIEF